MILGLTLLLLLGAWPAAAEQPAWIPRWIQVPDGYAIDYDRDPRQWAEPVDRDNVVGFGLYERRNMAVALSYDEESRSIGDGSDLFRIFVRWRW